MARRKKDKWTNKDLLNTTQKSKYRATETLLTPVTKSRRRKGKPFLLYMRQPSCSSWILIICLSLTMTQDLISGINTPVGDMIL